ncbi:MAG: hypothetical protein PHQ72_01310 [Hespellia sp.]|nr:hypothetical protein [Hespellia sp.]
MMKRINKKTILLSGAAFALTASLSVGSAFAYFTTYANSKGTVPVKMGFTETVPQEKVDQDGKHVTIKNTGKYDCYVRVKVFADIAVTYQGGADWTQGDGDYWYYGSILPAGGETPELLVSYSYPDTEVENPTEEFNIIVVQECTPVVYDDNGDPKPDWNHVITTQQD